MPRTRDVRLTFGQLDMAHKAVKARRVELEKRLERSTYKGKPGMLEKALTELSEARELEDDLLHNREALRRLQVDAIKAKMGAAS